MAGHNCGHLVKLLFQRQHIMATSTKRGRGVDIACGEPQPPAPGEENEEENDEPVPYRTTLLKVSLDTSTKETKEINLKNATQYNRHGPGQLQMHVALRF